MQSQAATETEMMCGTRCLSNTTVFIWCYCYEKNYINGEEAKQSWSYNDCIFHVIKNLITLTKLLSDKSKRLENIHFHILANLLMFVDMLNNCVGTFLGKEGGIHVLGGLALLSRTVEFAGQKSNLINL